MAKKNGTGPALETKVRLYRAKGKGKADLLGFADLVIGGAFVIKSIRIMQINPEKAAGVLSDPFVSFPSRRVERQGEETRYIDVAHPITSEAYHEAVGLIMAQYREVFSAEGKPA